MEYTTHQCVELFHLLFLNQLSQQLDRDLYAIKGGCNLRFYFNSFRYSEDLDIDVRKIAKLTLQKKVDNILSSIAMKRGMQTYNLAIDSVTKPKQTDTTQRWKIQIKLPTKSITIPTKIEFSRRKGQTTLTEFASVNKSLRQLYNLPPFFLSHYDAQSAFCQKISALAGRTETQARDIFDLYLLSQQINSVSLPANIKSLLPKAIEHAFSIDYATYTAQVVSYLEHSYQTQYADASIWEGIQLELTQLLEGYLNDTH